MEPKIILRVSVEECNIILAALSQRPYAEVMALLPKLQQEATQQFGNLNNPSAKEEN